MLEALYKNTLPSMKVQSKVMGVHERDVTSRKMAWKSYVQSSQTRTVYV